MTKINKSELFKSAWETVRRNRTGKYSHQFENMSTSAVFARALRFAWEEAKEEQKSKKVVKSKSYSKSSKSSRRVELLSVAIKNGLNHGASWYASGRDIDSKQLHPSWEGEEICYVYAA